MATQRPIFRNHAANHYFQRRQKDVLPRLITPSAFLLLWLLLALLLVAVFVLSSQFISRYGG